MAPRISVVMPAWNAERTISAALASVRRQSERDWECIVVDDGSADATASIAEAASGEDARVRVLRRRHEGLVAALSAGIGATRGALVARMDADDWMRRDRLAAQAAALDADAGLAAVGCHVRLFPRRGLSDGMREYERWLASIRGEDDVRREAFVECPLVHPTWMARTDVLRYREVDWPEDYDLLLRLLAEGRRVGMVPRRLLGWREGAARTWRRDARYALGAIAAAKASFLASGFLAGADAYHLWGFGSTGKTLRRALLAHGKRPASILELHPRRVGQSIDATPIVPPSSLRSLPRLPILVSTAGAAARARSRADLAALGFSETRDFLCVA